MQFPIYQKSDNKKHLIILVNLYLFDLEIKNHIKKKDFFTSECYLIDQSWLKKLKEFYHYKNFTEILTKAPRINKRINVGIEKLQNEFKNLYTILSNYVTKSQSNFSIVPDGKFEENFISLKYSKFSDEKKTNINYPISFEIVNEDVIKLLFTDNEINTNLISQKFKFIIKDEKMIIKTIENNNYLLIGNYDKNFEYELLLCFKNIKDCENSFQYLQNYSFNEFKNNFFPNLNNILRYDKNNKFNIYGKVINLKNNNEGNDKTILVNENNFSDQINNDIDLLIRLYFFNNELNYLLEQKLSTFKQTKKYFIVNAELIDTYKEFYDYPEITKIINSNNEIQKLIKEFKKNKPVLSYDSQFINEIKKLFPLSYNKDIFAKKIDDLIKKLSDSKLYDLKSNIEKIDIIHGNLKVFDNYFLIDEDIKKFLFTESKPFTDIKKYSEINCSIGNGRLFLIANDDKFINVSEFKNNSFFTCELFINCQNDYINQLMKKIENSDYIGYMSSLGFNEKKIAYIDNDAFAYKLKDCPYFKKKDGAPNPNNIFIKKKELKNVLLIFIDYLIIKQKIKEKFDMNEEKDYYLISKEWIQNYFQEKTLEEIYKSLLEKWSKSEKVINVITNKNYNIEQKVEIIISDFIKNNDKIFNLINHRSNNKINNSKVSFTYSNKEIIVNKEYKKIEYSDDFILLSKNTIQNLSEINPINKPNKNEKILFGENKVFLIRENLLQIGKILDSSFFNLELIFNFMINDDVNKCIQYISQNNFEKYYKNFLTLYENEYYSPIFDSNDKIIGDCYKYKKDVRDYSEYQINNKLQFLVKLFFNNKEISEKKISKKLIQKQFYLIDKIKLKNLKIDYNYYQLENELLNNNKLATQNIEKLKKSDEYNLFNDKHITLIIKNLPSKLNSEYNEIEKKSKNKDENEFKKIFDPPVEVFQYYNEYGDKEKLTCYNDFEFLNKEILNNKKNSDDNNLIDCYLIDNLLLIDLNKLKMKNDNKKYYEVGNLDKENNFNLYCFIIFDTSSESIDNLNFIFSNESLVRKIHSNRIYFEILTDKSNKKFGKIVKYRGPNDNIFESEESESQKLLVIYYENVESRKNNIKPIKEDFKGSPLKIGLKNVGCTCYMNATLQCFCQIEKLVNYFKYKRYVVDTIQENIFYNENNKNKKNILTSSFKYLIEHLWPSIYEVNEKLASQNENSNNISYAPSEFKNKISEMDPLFAGAQVNDAKYLVNFIVMTLHQELNKANLNDDINEDNIIVDSTNQQMMLEHFAKKFAMENKSIISEIFYAVYGSSISCTNCRVEKYNYQAYFFLTFPLEEVRKFVLNYQMMNNMMQFQQNYYNIQNINSVNIYDCFNYNQRPELMSGANSMYCNNCQNNFPFWDKPFITTGPEILIIVLNRGKGIQFDVKLEFYEDLNLQNYIQLQNTGTYYNLIGVITHMKINGDKENFVAICKSPIDNNWYNYNDDLVTPVYNFKEQIIENTEPYILFYQKFH